MISKPSMGAQTGGRLTNSRMLYLGYYMALGAFLPYISLYYERIGLSGIQIGFLSALMTLMISSTSVPWGAIADALHLHRRILSIALLLAPVTIFLLSQTTRYVVITLLVLVYAFLISPIIPLLDSTALEVAETYQRTYGEIRVWGTIGWIVSVWLVGALTEKFDIRWLFYTYIVFMGLTFVFSLFQPARMRPLQFPALKGLRQLVANRATFFFLLSIFLVAVGMGAVQNFFSLYLNGIGAGEGTIGLAWALAALSEVPVMIYSGAIMRRIGTTGLLKAAFVTYAFRWLLYSFISIPAWVLALQLLHGLSFAAFLTAGVTYLNERTPQGLSTTAQAIFSVVAFGLASFTGALVGGYLYDTLGMAVLFRVSSLATWAGLAIFWVSQRFTRNTPALRQILDPKWGEQ